MARVWQTGFELNSGTNGVEVSGQSGTAPTVQSTTARSGGSAMQVSGLLTSTAMYFQWVYTSPDSNGPYFLRKYLHVKTLPSGENRIANFQENSGAFTQIVYLTLDNTATLRLYDNSGQITGTTTILLNTWYCLEMMYDATAAAGSHIVEARLSERVFATSNTRSLSSGAAQFALGGNLAGETNTTGLWFFDDIALNDSSGSFQTQYPGNEHIIHINPVAAGDSNGFLVQVGGTAGSANNYTRVNEITPDDGTSYNASAVLNAEDLFAFAAPVIGAFGKINVVAVGARFANPVAADAVSAFKLELEKTSGGTKSQSASLIPNSTSWKTNSTGGVFPIGYPLVTYQTPDGEAWTQAFLNTLQAGYIESAAGTNSVGISTIWISIAYSDPPQATTTSTSSTSSTSSSTSSTSSSTSSTSSSISSTSLSTSSTSSSTSVSSTSSSISSTSSSISSTSISSTSSSTSISSTSSSISSTSTSSTSISSTSSSTSISSTSSSISSTSSSISSTSHSTSSTSVSSTSSSSSTSSTLPPSNLDYSYQDKLTLPANGADAIDPDTNKNIMNMAVNDGDYFIQYGSEYMVQEFKKQWTNNTDTPTFTWKGRSTESTLISAILIQIYNVNSAAWETLAQITKQPGDTDQTFTVSQSVNSSNYYDTRNVVTFRVYQQVL